MYILTKVWIQLKKISIILFCVIKFVSVKLHKLVVSKHLKCTYLEILHQSEQFLVIMKPYDMVINSNNPEVQVD